MKKVFKAVAALSLAVVIAISSMSFQGDEVVFCASSDDMFTEYVYWEVGTDNYYTVDWLGGGVTTLTRTQAQSWCTKRNPK